MPSGHGRASLVFEEAAPCLLVQVRGRSEWNRRKIVLFESAPYGMARGLNEFGVDLLTCGEIFQWLKVAVEQEGSRPTLPELFRRRPCCTEKDLTDGLVMKPIEVGKHLSVLEATGSVASRRHGRLVYYQLARDASSRDVGAVSAKRRRPCGSIELAPVAPCARVSSPRKHRRERERNYE